MRRALATAAIALAVGVPALIIYAALRAMQMLALGMLFICVLAAMA